MTSLADLEGGSETLRGVLAVSAVFGALYIPLFLVTTATYVRVFGSPEGAIVYALSIAPVVVSYLVADALENAVLCTVGLADS